jgi:hypothetical protein
LKKLIAGLVAALSFATFAPSAEAVTGAWANSDAINQSAQDCPHHWGGVCLRRRVNYVWGLGGGRWTVEVDGWETGFWDLSRDWHHARWYYVHQYQVEANGGHTRNVYGGW